MENGVRNCILSFRSRDIGDGFGEWVNSCFVFGNSKTTWRLGWKWLGLMTGRWTDVRLRWGGKEIEGIKKGVEQVGRLRTLDGVEREGGIQNVPIPFPSPSPIASPRGISVKNIHGRLTTVVKYYPLPLVREVHPPTLTWSLLHGCPNPFLPSSIPCIPLCYNNGNILYPPTSSFSVLTHVLHYCQDPGLD
jgi:hypothetical protein